MAKKRAKLFKTLAKGTLIIVGGHEDKKGEQVILREVASRVKAGNLVVVTIASRVGGELWADYRKVFKAIGVKKLHHIEVVGHHAKSDEASVRAIESADVVFFTGGDQLRITSQLGGSPILDAVERLYQRGGTVAGTSAGASVMSETMLVSGAADTSYRVGSLLRMAPGLGLTRNLIVDQHFAERGRIGRLLGAVAQNPKFLGVGIDEDTSIILEDDRTFKVLGSGAVYVVDAMTSTESNISDALANEALSIFNVTLHVLSSGDCFDIEERRPVKPQKLRQ